MGGSLGLTVGVRPLSLGLPYKGMILLFTLFEDRYGIRNHWLVRNALYARLHDKQLESAVILAILATGDTCSVLNNLISQAPAWRLRLGRMRLSRGWRKCWWRTAKSQSKSEPLKEKKLCLLSGVQDARSSAEITGNELSRQVSQANL